MVESGPSLSDGSGVGKHAHGARDLGEISTGHDGGRLVVDANLRNINYVKIILGELLTLNPVGHQSTNWMVRLVLMEAMEAFTSLGTTSPRYRRHTAMYFP